MGLQRCYIDAYEAPQGLLRDSAFIKALGQSLAVNLKLTMPCTLVVPCFTQVPIADTGVSVIGLGENCHVTCHSFDKRGTVFVDCCFPERDDWTIDTVTAVLTEWLRPGRLEVCNKPIAGSQGKFGKHIVLEMPALAEHEARKLLEDLVGEIGMHPLAGSVGIAGDGWHSALQPIMESHLAIHTRGKVSELDIFSCKNFSEEKIYQILPQAKLMQRIERGIYFPEPNFNEMGSTVK